MSTEQSISVYGIFLTPEEQEQQRKYAQENLFQWFKHLIEAEKYNPEKEYDYDGEIREGWLKKIAESDLDHSDRVKLLELLEKIGE